MSALPPNVTAYRDRHGKLRYRFRQRGRTTRSIPGAPGDGKFEVAYKMIVETDDPIRPTRRRRTVNEEIDREAFWRFCIAACGRAYKRAREQDVAFGLTPHMIDELLVDQHWRCAVSGIQFEAPGSTGGGATRPFGPSVDRIEPHRGYVRDNVRIVCNLVNAALGHWGIGPLMHLVAAISQAPMANHLANRVSQSQGTENKNEFS